jgi:hypothetical protein
LNSGTKVAQGDALVGLVFLVNWIGYHLAAP